MLTKIPATLDSTCGGYAHSDTGGTDITEKA
jgi:hypothetical protein